MDKNIEAKEMFSKGIGDKGIRACMFTSGN